VGATRRGAAPTILCRVQHHPARAHLLDRLLPLLNGLDVEVVTDDTSGGGWYPSAWRTYLACLSAPFTHSHLLIVQDDALPCPGFAHAAQAAVAARPDRMVAFFHTRQPKRTWDLIEAARLAGQRWVETDVDDWVPTVATCWPAPIVKQLLRWQHPGTIGRRQRGDDGPVGRFCKATGNRPLVTVPSLVEHPDDVRSLINGRHGANGSDRTRVAAVYVGDEDATLIDWA
jgi:hypothetical protein